jgi:hypothetical protein
MVRARAKAKEYERKTTCQKSDKSSLPAIDTQRALVAARIANLEKTDTLNQGARSADLRIGKISQDRAAQMLNVGKRSVQVAKEIIRKSPDSVPETYFRKH